MNKFKWQGSNAGSNENEDELSGDDEGEIDDDDDPIAKAAMNFDKRKKYSVVNTPKNMSAVNT